LTKIIQYLFAQLYFITTFVNIKQTKTDNMKATVIRKEGNEVKEIKFSKVKIARGYIKDVAILTKNGEVSYTLVKGK
jgi:hypothetical protein